MFLLGWIALWIVSAGIIAVIAYILPGVSVKSFGTALIVALVLGLINLFIRPLIAFFSLPITIITFGLFAFVINALMILLASAIVPNFKVNGFWNALLFSLLLSLARVLLLSLFTY